MIFPLLQFNAAQIEIAIKAGGGATKIVMDAAERNLLLTLVILLGGGLLFCIWLVFKINKASNQAREEDRKETLEKLEKLENSVDVLFKNTVLEFKEIREQDQERSDKNQTLIRDFALTFVSAMNEMKEHFRRNP